MMSDPEFAAIRETTIELLHFVSLYAFFDAMIVVFSNAVRGAGDTRFPMAFMLVTSWAMIRTTAGRAAARRAIL